MKGFRVSELDTLKRLADVIPDAVYVVDRNFALLHVNRRFRSMLEFRGRMGSACYDAARLGLCSGPCVLKSCMDKREATLWSETLAGQGTEVEVHVSAGASPLLDDAGEVVGAFVMLRDVDTEVKAVAKYREMLENERRQKENLEVIVLERTKDLRSAIDQLEQSRREVRDILDNIQQAVFTVAPSLLINREFSRHVLEVFGEQPIAERTMSDLLVAGGVEARVARELDDWLRLAFSQPLLPWDMVAMLVQHEHRFCRASDGSVRELAMEFRPIREPDGAIGRIMIVVADLTEKKALERDLEKKQRENEDNINQISEIIRLDPAIFSSFLAEAAGVLVEARATLPQLASSGDPKAVVNHLFRQMHTLKGNASSFKLNLIAAKAHWVEDTFAQLRDAQEIGQAVLDETASRVQDLEELLGKARDLAERVLDPGRDLAQTRSVDRTVEVTVARPRLHELQRALQALEGVVPAEQLRPMREAVRAMTLVPMSKLFHRFPKMVRDLATELERELCDFSAEGGEETLLDANVLHILGNPLVHILRNAVDHGLETAEARRARGKPAGGRIALRARYEDDQLVVEVEDDGRGIDGDAVARQAVARRLIDPARAQRLSPAEAVELIFLPGLSTSETVSEVSGRGVGMDVVRATIRELGGEVHLQSMKGAGTRLRLTVPRAVAEGRAPPRAA